MKTFLVNVDLQGNNLLNFRAHAAATAPSATAAGQVYYDTVGNALYYSTGTGTGNWSQVSTGSSAVSSLNSLVGALTIAGTSNQIAVNAASSTITLSLPTNVTLPGKTTLTASTTSAASLNIPSGSAPTSPTSGDLWNASGVLYYYNGSATRTVAVTADKLSAFASTSSSELAGVISDETGSGALVFGTSPTITTSLVTGSTTFALVNTTATTVNFAGAATTLSIGAATGTTTVNNSLVVKGDLTVDGSVVTVNSTTLTVDDKNIELGSVASPSDTTADGGGITLKGATDKTFNWVNATDAWTSSEHLDLASGKAYYINGASVLNGTTLGSAVVNSSLTKVGALSGGTAGVVKVDASGNLTSAATLANTDLTNSTISGVALGSNLFSLSAGTGLTWTVGSAYNGSAASTLGFASGNVSDTQDAAVSSVTYTYAVQKVKAIITGDAAKTSFPVIHALNTRDVTVQVYQTSASGPATRYSEVEVDIVRTDANTITVSFASAPASGVTYNVVVVG